MKLKHVVAALIIALIGSLLAACGGGGGGGGNTVTAENSVVTAVKQAAPIDVCPNGGITVDAGIDTNGNGVLDASEITSTQYVCNGANGSSGSTALVSMTNESAGTNCASGGKKVSVGLDTNNNGVLDSSEITSIDYICNGASGTDGTNGTNGLNSLVSIVSEPAGVNCANGGVKVLSGLDANSNGTLDAGEAGTPTYVCSGPPAPSVPAAPTNVQAVGGDGQVTISWSPVSGAYSYNIYWSTTGNVYKSDNVILNASMPYVHTGVQNGVAYYYRVTAVNITGESNLSSLAVRIPFTQSLEKLLASDVEAGAAVGNSVSISGDYAIVGAYGKDEGGLIGAGAAYIFHRTGPNTWDSGTKITAPVPESGAGFGTSVSISGDYAVVGAYGKDEGVFTNAGAAYIY